ncbi:MAG TPA: hypothetical protein VGO97_04790 [Solirubrobacterales bacterium]|jgi:hypothetical protein|nr:hypothetical protein [Solirubrobacterales bacterium]
MARDKNISPIYDDPDAEDRPEGIGGLVDDLTSGRLLGDTVNRLVDAGERLTRAQQSAFSALGIPSGSQFEHLTLRVRTIFHRLDELEDDIDRLERRLSELESRSSAKQSASRRATAAPKRPAARKRP